MQQNSKFMRNKRIKIKLSIKSATSIARQKVSCVQEVTKSVIYVTPLYVFNRVQERQNTVQESTYNNTNCTGDEEQRI